MSSRANPAKFSPSRCLEESSGALRCGALSAIAVRHAFAVSSLDVLRACQRRRAGSRSSEEKSGQAPRRTQNEGTVFSAPGRRAWHRDGTGRLPIVPVEAFPRGQEDRHQIALRFIPEQRDCFDASGKSRALHGHHIRVIVPREINRRAPRRGSRRRVARAPRRRRCWSAALPTATRPFVSACRMALYDGVARHRA